MNPSPIHKSFGYALSGILHTIRENRNAKIHILIGVIAVILSFVLGIERNEKIIVFVLTVIVISSEMINTAIEEMTDLITNEHRKEAKIAKDVAAGMVLVTSVGAAIVGLIIFWPYIF